jgi:hypothetical protein
VFSRLVDGQAVMPATNNFYALATILMVASIAVLRFVERPRGRLKTMAHQLSARLRRMAGQTARGDLMNRTYRRELRRGDQNWVSRNHRTPNAARVRRTIS